jgi:hypothetical protein
MGGTTPGADELRIRGFLRQLEVGPDAEPPAIPPKPVKRERDWLDDILDSDGLGKPGVREPRTPGDPGTTGEEPELEDGEEEPLQVPPRWDPVAIADRIVHAYQQRPASVRLKHAAQVVVASRARWGQLIYTASGGWMAWRVGFTPWLLHFTHDAPVGIPIALFGVGWAVNRGLDPYPLLISWCGRAIYTATVINLVLHP